MKKKLYRIFAGLSGGFGGARYIRTIECINEEQAMEFAYEAAWEEYDSYGGFHGLLDDDDIEEALAEKFTEEELENPSDEIQTEIDEYTSALYQEDFENWADYYVEETNNLNDPDDD